MKTYKIGSKEYEIKKPTLHQHELLTRLLTETNSRLEFSLQNGAEIVLAIGTFMQRLLDSGRARDVLIYLLSPIGKPWTLAEMEQHREAFGECDEETLTEIVTDFFILRTVSLSTTIASLMNSATPKNPSMENSKHTAEKNQTT